MPRKTVKEALLGKRRVAKVKPKTTIKSIRIMRAEGRKELCGKWHRFKTLAGANAFLTRGSRTAPKGGASDKHDFVVKFKDGSVYDGRYELHHSEAGDLKKHMLSHVNFILSPRYTKMRFPKPKQRAEQRKAARTIKKQLLRM